jgi:hypothetical protein
LNFLSNVDNPANFPVSVVTNMYLFNKVHNDSNVI